MVHIRLPSKDWSLPQAAGDLLARVESGEIDVSITEFEGASAKAHGHGGGEKYFSKLFALCQQNKNRKFVGESEALPMPVRMSVKEAILGLFPEDGFLMVTPKREWHDIKKRDEWLKQYSRAKPPVPERSFISSNYLSRADLNCSYDGMAGIKRRWLVIEDDKLTLEQQCWIHKELSRRHHNLNCVCYSGGKSLHGWYLVQGWTEKQCYELYAVPREKEQLSLFSPPFIKPNRMLHADDLLRRNIGGNRNGGNATNRDAQLLILDEQELDASISRTENWLCSQGLFSGKALCLDGETGKPVAEIDYGPISMVLRKRRGRGPGR